MQINKKMSEKTNIRIGVSIGDLNGVGLEVVMKTFADERMLDFCTPVLFASNKVIAFGKKQFGIGMPHSIANPCFLIKKHINGCTIVSHTL